MKFKGTWIFLIVVVLLGALTVWDFQREEKETARKDQESRVVTFNQEHVQKIKIAKDETEIELDKTVDGWKLLKPVEDWADNSEVENIVQTITEQKVISTVTEGNEIDWTLYGLDKPTSKWTVIHHNGEELSYEVGSKKSYDGNPYIRRSGQDAVLMVNSAAVEWLNKPVNVLRDRRILRGKIANVSKVELNNRQGKMVLEKKDTENLWISPQHPDWKLDQNRIREFLVEISEAKGRNILAEGKISSSDLNRYGLNKPSVTLNLSMKDEKRTIQFGQDKDQASFVLTSDPSFIMRVEPPFMNRVKFAKTIEFRDKRIPFDYNKDLVKAVEIDTTLKKTGFVKKDDKWKLSPADDSQQARQDRVEALVAAGRNVQILEYTPTPQKLKLKNKMTFKDQENKLIFELAWGDFKDKKFDDVDRNVALAKTNLSEDTFYIEKAEIDKFQLTELIEPRPDSKAETSKDSSNESNKEDKT